MRKIKIILSLTFVILMITGCGNKIEKDIVKPTVTFSVNGNQIYAKTYSSKVTANDNQKIDSTSLKYQWTTSNIAPTEASFMIPLTNGDNISAPVGVTGSYYLWVMAKDMSGNSIMVNSAVFNLDNTIPVIKLMGNQKFNMNTGMMYNDMGATATDNIDGNITSKIVVDSNVNYKKAGTYRVIYTVTDAAGNAATVVARNVIVTDTDTMASPTV